MPSIGYPNQHLGHLTAQEGETFEGFKLFLQEKGLYQPGPPASHDDATLLYARIVLCAEDLERTD